MKGQAATEFLMTYGWALLVVLIAISALAYFGVLSPSKFLPESCMLDPGYQCVDYQITEDDSSIIVKNAAGDDIIITNVKIGSCEESFDSITVRNSDQQQFSLTGCDNGITEASFKADISITYNKVISNFTKIIKGEIITKINWGEKNMKTNKGQAATEFLMTYGWALLVVLIAISTLAYFGVLSPGRFLPEKCTVDPGFACLDWIVDSAAGETTLVM